MINPKLIPGENVLLEFFENGQWWIYKCARSASIILSVEMIETSVSGSGIWSTSLPTKNNWRGTLEGIMTTTDNAALTLADLLDRCMNHTEMMMSFQATDLVGGVIRCTGNCYLTGVTQTGSFDNIATFNADFIGTGALTQSYSPIVQPTPKMYRYEYTASGSETGFTDAALKNKQIIFASKDGDSLSKIVTGTPADKELKYVVSTGEVGWMVPAEPGEEIVLGYQNL